MRHLPRRSSKNCDLQSANVDRLKANYGIDDTVSAFHGIGKKTAWAVWCSMPPLATVFSQLARAPSQVSPVDLDEIEIYVVLLYHRTPALSHVNETRKQLFAQNRKTENLPPTLHALEQHVKS